MTQPTADKARARLAAFLGYEPDEHDALFESHLDAYRAAILQEAAAAIDTTYPGFGIDRYVRHGADLLRRMADGAAS